MSEQGGAPPPIDTAKPHSARMYDYYLGGKTHYEADVQAAEAVVAKLPEIVTAARANRDFMIRVTRTLAAEYGVRQFLDIGSGIPTEPNLHQVAQSVAPEARVVYTDNDPIVLQYAQALLHSTPEGRTAYLHADVTKPESLLEAAELHATLDLERPVAVSVNALVHFIPDEQGPDRILRALVDRLAPGSFLSLSHGIADVPEQDGVDRINAVVDIYRRNGTVLAPRSREQVTGFFDGLELLDPGITQVHLWRPDTDPHGGLPEGTLTLYAGVARKP
ncbi:SAM-dependent methyltransferase [Streptomyces oryzae]|uniref:SAM-dependent methyltransferase n=1 Tax=Streptomyces oryzae TaxID=1434886 RepID=A0ABS3XGG2_9ACTN|nr:SAM-dependent methyltransferase [Streptomyces oryzae]MBO8194379.1 SAM-dependent methyltransferase [Streptomyces oryzae]